VAVAAIVVVNSELWNQPLMNSLIMATELVIFGIWFQNENAGGLYGEGL